MMSHLDDYFNHSITVYLCLCVCLGACMHSIESWRISQCWIGKRFHYSRMLHNFPLILNDDVLPPFLSGQTLTPPLLPPLPLPLALLALLPPILLFLVPGTAAAPPPPPPPAPVPVVGAVALLACKYRPWSRIFRYKLMYLPAAVVRGTMYFSQNSVLENANFNLYCLVYRVHKYICIAYAFI